jgi:hypothetical protein
LVTFSEGDYLYLKEMAIGVGKSKKFCDRWRGRFLITKRLSDWNYQIQLKPDKEVVVSVNRMKKCHSPPSKKRVFQRMVPDPKIVPTGSKSRDDDFEPPDTIV